MKKRHKLLVHVLIILIFAFSCFGFATLTDHLFVSGRVTAPAPQYDVYITDTNPQTSAGVTVKTTTGTIMFMEVKAGGTAKFTVDFINVSDKTYVYERVIDGAETNIDGVYNGTAIKYTVSGVSSLDEIAPDGGTLSLQIEIAVPAGVTTDMYVLKFNFIEKQGIEILPGQDERTITFKYNNNTPDTTLSLHDNEFIPRPTTPTKSGYTFAGWYTDINFTTAWNFEADVVKGDMTLYAKWDKTPTSYKVIFVPNNGDANYAVTSPANELLALPTAPEKDGHVFIGWYRDAATTDPWNFDTDKLTSNITLYAGWDVYVDPTPPYLDITFKYNNGQEDTVTVVLTGEFIPRPQTPVKDGYRFIGWYTDEECTDAWNFEAERPEWHMTLYGGWEKIIEYTVTFKHNNGMPDSTVTVEAGSLIPIPDAPVKDGYSFIGWYTDSACTTAWNIDIDRPTSNMTLYAGWQEETEDEGHKEHGMFLGLVEILISKATNCLNQNNTIFNAVMNSLNSGKRPDEDPPIVHCQVNSVSGGNMAKIASDASSMLDAENDYYFIFMAEEDPAHKNTRLYLYMYYGHVCDEAAKGTRIMVYKQVLTRGSDGKWFADGTYKGHAVVDSIFGGGNNAKDVKTVNPYTWMSGEVPTE